jgi:DNA repair exonuclease SbcCD nuclease subunit
MVVVDPNTFDAWDRTILGHYHGAQQLNEKVEYIGSPLQLSFGEAFQKKHVMIFDLDTHKKTYVENSFSPDHLIVSAEDIQNEAYNLDGKFVRLAVEDTGRKDIIDIKRKIATESKPLSFDVKKKDTKKVESEEDLTALEDVQAVLDNIEDVLEQYVKDKGVPDGMKKPHLLKVGKQCLVKRSA